MGSKRQMTQAKRAREQAVKEKRALKQERKRNAAAAREAEANGGAPLVEREGEQPTEGELEAQDDPAVGSTAERTA